MRAWTVLLIVGAAAVGGRSSAAAQDEPVTLSVWAGWLNPDGKRRSIEGTRKIVQDDLDGAPALGGQLAWQPRSGLRLTLGVLASEITQMHEEVFGDGSILRSQNGVKVRSLLLGPGFRAITSPDFEMWVGLQGAYTVYEDKINVLSETDPPPLDSDPPVPNVVTWDIRNDLRMAISTEFVAALTEALDLEIGIRRILTDLEASVVGGPAGDVRLDANPWGLLVGVRIGL